MTENQLKRYRTICAEIDDKDTDPGRRAELEAEKAEVERYVDSIDDYDIRRIIILRYIRGKRRKSWQHIAMQMGYCSEHTPRRKLKKFFSMAEMADL